MLGSTQPDDVVDRQRAEGAGVEVTRRASGGGAVLVVPGELLWADVFVARDDPRWEADVGRSFHWLGEAWAGALGDLGVAAGWHAGPFRPSPWSRLVCFAGLGPGEVATGGRKVVGMSQRRTRDGSLFSCAALLAWAPAPLLDVLALEQEARRRGTEDLVHAAAAVPCAAADLVEAFTRRAGPGRPGPPHRRQPRP